MPNGGDTVVPNAILVDETENTPKAMMNRLRM
jgi:hypothetical protein